MLELLSLLELRKILKDYHQSTKLVGIDLGGEDLYYAKIIGIGWTTFTWEWYADDSTTYLATNVTYIRDVVSLTLEAVEWSRAILKGGQTSLELWQDLNSDDDEEGDDED